MTTQTEALADQPAQEPIYQSQDSTGKWADQAKHSYDYNVKHGSAVVRVVYTTPQAQSKPLTDEQIDELARTMVKGSKSVNWLCRAIEAAHGIKEQHMKTVIEMAYEAGFSLYRDISAVDGSIAHLERFAALIRADERNSWPAEMEAMERQVNILTDALAKQPAQQEPVAWMYQHPNNHLKTCYQAYKTNGECTPLYTTPQAKPAREWVGLTEEEKTELRRKHYPLPLLLMDATEAKLKEKNT